VVVGFAGLVRLGAGIRVNSIEGPELTLCDWQLVSAMQKTGSSDRCKKTGTNSRS
jgi:hypothetical protein